MKTGLAMDCPTDLSTLTSNQLRTELTASLARTVAEFRRLAWIVRLLEERGEDLTDLRLSLLPYLRKIAYGQLLPEIMIRFSQSPGVMRVVASLPMPDQEKLANGERIPMAIRTPDGKLDKRLVDPLGLRADQLSLVFTSNSIRPIEDQMARLETPTKPPRQKTLTMIGRMRPDEKLGGAWVGRTFIPKADMVRVLALLAGPDNDDDSGRHQIAITLNDAQHERLDKAARDGATKMSRLIQRSMRATGLI